VSKATTTSSFSHGLYGYILIEKGEAIGDVNPVKEYPDSL
jgi:hypothetical protein